MSTTLSPEDSFHLQFGKTLDAWADLEMVLSWWFAHLTGMQTGMARAIFYSGNSFSTRRDMLSAALEEAQKMWAPAIFPGYEKKLPLQAISDDQVQFLSMAFRRAGQYSSSRNSVAHRMFVTNQNSMQVQLVDRGRWWDDEGLTIGHLKEMESRFNSLKVILRDVHTYVVAPQKASLPMMSLAEGLRQACDLPKEAYTRSSSQSSTGQQIQPPPSPKGIRKPRPSSAQKRQDAARNKVTPSS